jgi:hypothetical protein
MKIDIGTVIRDGGKIGIVRNVIVAGTWSEEPLFNWTTSCEIEYNDGSVCVMTELSILRLIEMGKIEVIVE